MTEFIGIFQFIIVLLASLWVIPLGRADGGIGGRVDERIEGGPDSERSLKVIQTLEQVPLGKALISKALMTWRENQKQGLASHFKWGNISHTDTIITRKFNPDTGKEVREREMTIYLKMGQSSHDVALDLAHELVHATARPSFDPYDSDLTVGKYIFAAIEGEGGEIQAVEVECGVGLEFQKGQSHSDLDRCKNYFTIATGVDSIITVDRLKIKMDFYRVGDHRKALIQALQNEAVIFPHLSDEPAHLYSSTGHTPYPVALFKEYEEMTQMACENSKRQINSLSLSLSAALPSSFYQILEPESSQQKTAKIFLSKRCQP